MKNLTFSKLSLSMAVLALLTVFSLAGCGGGGGSDSGVESSSTSTEFSGIASKGPVVNGTITAFSIVNGQKGVALASTTSDSSGNYTLKLGAYTGPVLIEVTGGSYKDEATGNTVALASTLHAAIADVAPNKSGSTLIKSASVTPITEAAVKNASASAGGLTAANIQTANDVVKTQLGFDPVSTQPADATSLASATASTAAKAYAGLVGTVSQYLKDNPSKSLDNAISDFAIALKAGGSGLTGNALITAAGNNFGANANNQTGVSSMAALQALIVTLATIDDEDPVSQRAVAAALFKDDSDSILLCGNDSVSGYNAIPKTCNVKYNYNLSGMPGCFSIEESNYIDHYSKINGVDWKTPGFLCAQTNIYASDRWSMNDGRVMDGTHNGIDFLHKATNGTPPAFYAVAPGKVIRAGTGDYKTIAVYLADPSDPTNTAKGITTLYLHASSVNTALVPDVTTINTGDPLGYQGNSGLPAGAGEHVHISVRVGKSYCACSTEKNGYLPPIATLLTYLNPTPTGLAATAASASQINLSWSASTDAVGVTGYKIYRGGTYLKSASTTTSSDTGLSASTQYCYQVSAYDAVGNESNKSSQACATTSAMPDTTPPTVTSTSPTNSATNIAVNTAITATFSEAMDVSTLTSATFILNNGVTGTVTYNGTTATFTPTGNLAYSTTYTATITTGVKDGAGNAMAAAYTWTFTTGTTVGATGRMPDTGQTTSYTTTFGEDHDYTINPPSYTDNGDGTNTDTVTGLVWQKQDDATARTWADAGTYCDVSTLGGYSDWRLPSRKELISLVDYSVYPSINPTYFPGISVPYYWSSTTSAEDTSNAWSVIFSDGSSVRDSKTNSYYVLCVRGEQITQNLTDNGNGTVTDSGTLLMWQQGDSSAMTWEGALSHCEGLSLAGNTDWRLPNTKELASIVDDMRYFPTINTTLFPGTSASWSMPFYWSSTTNRISISGAWAWAVDFIGGSIYYTDKTNSYYARCVRGGQ